MMKLKGKVVFITGSSRGIGKSFAMGFAKEGADVIVHGRDLGEGEGSCPRIGRVWGQSPWQWPEMSPHPRM